MAFFDWDDKYSVGVAVIDKQHKQIFTLVSQFYDTIRQKDVKKAMNETLQGLIDYAEYHFSAEEKYMQQAAYPQLATHQAQHGNFVEKVTDFRARLQAGELVIPIELANFLKEWLSNHILVDDQKYAPYLKESNG